MLESSLAPSIPWPSHILVLLPKGIAQKNTPRPPPKGLRGEANEKPLLFEKALNGNWHLRFRDDPLPKAGLHAPYSPDFLSTPISHGRSVAKGVDCGCGTERAIRTEIDRSARMRLFGLLKSKILRVAFDCSAFGSRDMSGGRPFRRRCVVAGDAFGLHCRYLRAICLGLGFLLRIYPRASIPASGHRFLRLRAHGVGGLHRHLAVHSPSSWTLSCP